MNNTTKLDVGTKIYYKRATWRTTELARQTYRATQMGRMAFARGLKAASALDEQFCEMLKGVSLSDGLVLLDAWAFGWHSANTGH